MPGPNVDRLYDQLKPAERLRLVLEAMARDDATESQRLHGTCPRGSFTGPDRKFSDRIEMAFAVASVVLVDLRCMWGKLHMLQWVRGNVVKDLVTAQHVTAALAFIDGEQCGQGEPQIHFFAQPLPEIRIEDNSADDESDVGQSLDDDETRDEPDLDEEDDEDDKALSEHDIERGLRMDAVHKRAEHFTACGLLAITLAEKDIAQDLVETWAAFSRFCRTRVGVTPETMLRAW